MLMRWRLLVLEGDRGELQTLEEGKRCYIAQVRMEATQTSGCGQSEMRSACCDHWACHSRNFLPA